MGDRFLRAAGLGLGTLALAGPLAGRAGATGYEVREQSAVGQGAAFAGAAARGDDPSMIFFNPAAMASLPGVQGAIVGSGIFPNAEPRSGNATHNALLGGSPISGGLGGNVGVDAFVPSFYSTIQLAPDWHFGLSVTSPWGLVTKTQPDSIARYYALTTSLRTVNITPAVAWQVTPTLSVGAGINVEYATSRLSSAVDFGSIGAAARIPGYAPGGADGRSTVGGNDTSVGWQLGAQWQPLAGTRVGLAFRSAVWHTLNGETQLQGVPFPLSLSPAFANAIGQAKVVTPETVTLGVSQRIDDRWTALAGLEWTNWSRFHDLTVTLPAGNPSVTEEHWKDTVFVSVGGEYRWNEALTLRAGFAFDQTPVRDAFRTPRIPDNNRYWLSTGASYQVSRNITLTAAYTHIFADDTTVNLTDPGPNNTNLFRGNLTATYRASVDIVTAQLRFAF